MKTRHLVPLDQELLVRLLVDQTFSHIEKGELDKRTRRKAVLFIRTALRDMDPMGVPEAIAKALFDGLPYYMLNLAMGTPGFIKHIEKILRRELYRIGVLYYNRMEKAEWYTPAFARAIDWEE
jgi:hypothetical protein